MRDSRLATRALIGWVGSLYFGDDSRAQDASARKATASHTRERKKPGHGDIVLQEATT